MNKKTITILLTTMLLTACTMPWTKPVDAVGTANAYWTTECGSLEIAEGINRMKGGEPPEQKQSTTPAPVQGAPAPGQTVKNYY